jgi:predicted phage-related endonuclease
MKKIVDKYGSICYNTNVKKSGQVDGEAPNKPPCKIVSVAINYFIYLKGENVMETIVVVIEETKLITAEELRKIEEKKMEDKIVQLQELELLMDEVKSEMEKIKDELKMEMKKRETEEMKVGRFIVRWTEVLSSRFDTTKFKTMFPGMYKDFTKEVASRRFSIS